MLEGSVIKIEDIKHLWNTLYSTDRRLALTLCAWRIAAVAHIDRRQYFMAYCCHLHTQPRAHDRMQRRRRDARALLFIRYLFANARATEGLPGPAGDRFEKLLIVLFWKGVPLVLLSPPPSLPPSFSLEEAPFHANCWLARRWRIGRDDANVPLFRSAREGSSRGGVNRWVETGHKKSRALLL